MEAEPDTHISVAKSPAAPDELARDKAQLRALLDISRDIGFILDTDRLLTQVIESLEIESKVEFDR